MKLSNFLRRSLAMLVLLATLLSLVPSVFAAKDELGNELTAVETLSSTDGKVTRAVTPVQNDNINLSNKEILAFYVDPAYFTATDARIDALTARGVTDFYVKCKEDDGALDTDLLTSVIEYAGTAARVHAWLTAGRDDTYLASNPTHSQYHFRVGYNCNAHDSSSSYYDTRNGWVDLSQSAYVTYFNSQINTIEAVSGVDGVLVDVARYGADYYGFGPELKAKVTQAEYNELAKALCAHYGYTYNTNGTIGGTSGYYTFKGTTTADNTSFTTLLNANGTAAQKYIAHRSDVVKTFLSKVKSSCAITFAAVVQPEVVSYSSSGTYPRNNYGIGLYGQDPAKYAAVTDYVVINSFMGDYWAHTESSYKTNFASNCAIAFAKMGCNVVAGIQADSFTNDDTVYSSSNTSGRGTGCYPSGAELRSQAEYMNDARRSVNGDPTIGGDILGVAVREAGSTAMARITYSGGVFTINIVAGATAISEIQIRLNNSLYAKTTATSYTYNSQTWTASGTASSGGYYPRLTANISVSAYGTKTLKIQACTATGGTPSLSYDNAHPVSILVWNSTTNNNSTVRSIYQDSHVGSAHTSCSFTKTTPQAATCQAAGYNLYTCSTCGYDYAEYVAKNASAHVAVTDPAVAATCTATGLTEGSHCSLCNTVITAQQTVAMLPHTEVTSPYVAPTCTTPGSTGGTHCSVCNTVLSATETIPALGHTIEILPAVNATCEESGLTEGSRCTVCNTTIIAQEVIGELGHDYVAVTTPATCVEQGYTTYTCSQCPLSYVSDYVDSFGHDYVAVVTDPTCKEGGYTTYTCSLCNNSYTSDHTPIADHDYIATVVPPTCTESGYTTYTCTMCGSSYNSDVTQPTEHDYIATTVAPTCNSVGYTQFACTCGDSYIANYVPALSHSYVYTDNGENHIVTCENCDYNATEDHSLSGVHCTLCKAFVCNHSKTTIVVDVAATCTTDGSQRSICAVCGETISTETVPALGHDVSFTAAVKATCEKNGNNAYWQCANCSTYFADNACQYVIPESFVFIAATGHNYNAVVIAPTCEKIGFTSYTCSKCNNSYAANEVAALGHSYSYTNNGDNHTATCANCSDSVTEDHTYVDGTCACGATEVVAPKPDANLAFTMSISAGAEMTVTYSIMGVAVNSYADFYLEVKKDVAGGDPITTVYGITEDREPMTAKVNPATGEALMYQVTYKGINAKEMGDNFSTTLYAVAEDGTVYCGATSVKSIKSYLLEKADAEASIPELKTMAIDMLKYGAAAQVRLGYNTENLVTADLTEEQLSYATQEIPEAVNYAATSGTGAAVNTNITVTSRVQLNLSCIYTTATDPNAVKCVITDSEGKVLAEIAATNKAGIMFSAIYEDVGAKQMRDVINATFYEGETAISQTVSWSVESYVAQVRAKTNVAEDELNMVNAMLTYGDAVAAYMEAK